MANRLNVANIGYNDATDALTIDSSGNVTAAGTLSAGTISEAVADAGVTIDGLTLKDGGIQFRTETGSEEAGVTFGSGTLDDYEEGSFTPVFQGATTAGTYPPGTTIGRYVKIGGIVYVAITLLDISTDIAGSGSVQITGLPFNSINISTLQHTGKAFLSRFTLTGGGSDDGFCTLLGHDSNAFSIIKATTGASGTGYALDVSDKASNSADIFVSFTYRSS